MSFMEKVQFWKNKPGLNPDSYDDQLALPDIEKPYTETMIMPQMPNQMPAPPINNASSQYPSQTNNRDNQLIEAKLDTIKSMLENINQRLENIERLAKE